MKTTRRKKRRQRVKSHRGAHDITICEPIIVGGVCVRERIEYVVDEREVLLNLRLLQRYDNRYSAVGFRRSG